MILEIDLGNSRIKWRLRGESGRLAGGFLGHSQWPQLSAELASVGAKPTHIWVASVLAEADRKPLIDWCGQHWGLAPRFAETAASAAGVRNSYADPSRMGVDRWLALLAARRELDGPLLLVQAGTAVTVDLLDASGQHLGGYIGPGWRLMRQALQGQTARVTPASEPPERLALTPGCSTESAVEAALSAMVAGLVERAERTLTEQTSGPAQVVLAGGDGHLLTELWPSARWWPDIVLDGLAPALEG